MQSDRYLEAEFDRVLTRELNGRTKLADAPSQHIQAWRDYEQQKFAILGRNPKPAHMGYNLWTDSVKSLQWARCVLTDKDCRKQTGFTARTVPRRALCRIASAIGYRYMRGLETIAQMLHGAELEKFNQERQIFRSTFELAADAAHAINDRGQNPEAALAVVQLFADELLALCPWLETVGQQHGAKTLLVETARAAPGAVPQS